MSEQRIVVGLDLGSHRVTALVAELGGRGGLRVLGLGTVPSQGIRKGVIVGFEPAVEAVREAVAEAERASGLVIRAAFPNVSGEHFRAIPSEGVHAKEGREREITPEDVEQVIRVARSLQLPPGYRILHTLPVDFILDGRSGIKDPVGMDGVRLQAEVLLFMGEGSVLENTAKVVEKAGLSVEGLVFSPLATAMAALTESEREEGVVLIDIGSGTTEVLVVADGAARHAEVLPLGGGNVTRDLSIGLGLSLTDAERLKLDHASVGPLSAADAAAQLTVRQVGADADSALSARTLHSIVEPRVRELLELAWDRAQRSPMARSAGCGVVLCGGGALLPGLTGLAAQLFERSVRLGAPLEQQGLIAELADPRYTPVVGLLRYGYERLVGSEEGEAPPRRGLGRLFRAMGAGRRGK